MVNLNQIAENQGRRKIIKVGGEKGQAVYGAAVTNGP